MGTLAMKKITISFLIFLLLFTLGRNSKIKAPSENSIPFLTFAVNEKNHNVEAYLNYWDTEKGKIIQIDDIVYTTNKVPRYSNGIPLWGDVVEYYAYPLSWDGESYIYLSSQYHKIKNPLNFEIKMFDDPRDVGKFASGKIIEDYDFFSYSKDLQVRTKNVGGINYLNEKYGDFTFTAFNGDKVMKKEVKISLYNDVFHGGVSSGAAYLYDKDKNEVKALYLYYDRTGMGHFLICTINLEKGTYDWHEVTGIEGCIPNMDQMDISIIGNSFYVPMCGNGVGRVNLDDYSCKFAIDRDELFRKLSSYLPSTPSHIISSYPYSIHGEYRDILILGGMFVFGGKPDEEPTFENFRQVYVAFNTKTSEVMGILEWNVLTPEFFIVRDKNGKELSKIATDKLVKGISKLPSVDGGLYRYGHFLDSGFIRFPHKNGD